MTWPVKLIAFYLPQFHPIPENDRWWGKGFTEWTNVARSRPLFPGHHQPQLPADLGFYDLRVPEVREEQVALAREAGIHGFCYYHYWFNGKHLLERPFNEVLASGKPDFPFCLCWANENWTRRWDGAEQEVLIGQNYGDDDDKQHIEWLIQAFRDPRYIRVDGRPLILIYRARHLPNPRRTLDIWRREARRAGIGDLYICRVENFANERDDPHALGFDASVDFQPDWMALPMDHPELSLPDGHVVVDYKMMVQAQLQRPEPAHKRFLGVTPSWDNSARRKKKAFIIANSSPEVYGYWLEQVVRRTMDRPPEERLVFVNAWNEWAEGNHLEPDQKFGHAYLEATRKALDAAGDPLGLVPLPLFKPLEFDGYVIRTYYQDWLKTRSIGQAEAPHFDRLFSEKTPPRLSVLLDATGADTAAVSASLQSVAAQQYPQWHLTVFAAGPAPEGLNSPQVTWLPVAAGSWPACLGPALDAGSGQWHVVLRAGETLVPHALLMIAAAVIARPELMIVATDGDWVNDQGQPTRLAPMSGLNPQRLWAQPEWRGLVACRQPLLAQAAADAAATHPSLLRPAMMLRAMELPTPLAAEHCQFVAVHMPESLAVDTGFQARGNLVAAHLAQLGHAASLSPGLTAGSQRLQFDFPGGQPPTVAILLADGHQDLPTLQRCLETVLAATTTLPFVLRLPLHADMSPEHQAFLQGIAGMGLPNVQIVPCDASPFAATANQLAAGAATDILVFLDARCLPLSADWLDTLARHAAQPMTGAVGARLVDAQGAIHTAFIRLGLGGTAASPYVGMSANYEGVGDELQLDQNASAVSARCLALRKEVFDAVGGFRPDRYADRHADTDLCLRIGERGLGVVWTPHATLLCGEVPAAVDDDFASGPEDDVLLSDWLPRLATDPHFNRQLSRSHRSPTLEPDLSLSWDPLPWRPAPRVYVHPADASGSGEVRIRAPSEHLRRTGRLQVGGGFRTLHPAEMAALRPDSVVLQRPFTDVVLDYLRQLKRHVDTFLIYELDDLITRIPKENAHHAGFPADMEARVSRGMGLCDRLVVSTAPLADTYRRHCGDVRVVANYLDGQAWGKVKAVPRPGGRFRVGWAGSTSHGGDLALIEECVRKTAGEVDWVFLGLCPPSLASHAKEIHPAIPIAEYPQALANLSLDLAVAPLAINAFNEAKSHLKLLEYGFLGCPVVCTDILPYQGDFPVTRLPNKPARWIEAIRAHVADQDEARRQGQALRDHVLARWMLEGHLDEWLHAWLP